MEKNDEIKIRAFTYHLPLPNKEQVIDDYLENTITFSFNKIKKVIEKKTNMPLLTRRIVFPYIEELYGIFGKSIEKNIEKIYEKYGERKDIDYIGIPFSEIRKKYLQIIPELLLSYPKLFMSIKYVPNNSNLFIDLLKEISSHAGWINATHFAVSFGNQLVTPYFPASISKGKGYSLSLLYPNYIKARIKENTCIKEILDKVAKYLLSQLQDISIEFKDTGNLLGIDYSLSPWKDNSVAKLLERINNNLVFSLPGTLSSIFQINLALLKIAHNYKGIGYNEIMLPLAEDNYLKDLTRNDEVSFNDFISYISVCVAGLDMIPIPSWTDIKILQGIFADLYSLSQHKGKTLGLRLILADAEPREEIDLGMFGYTPVLDPLK